MTFQYGRWFLVTLLTLFFSMQLSGVSRATGGWIDISEDQGETAILGSGFDLAKGKANDRCIEPTADTTLINTAKAGIVSHDVQAITTRDGLQKFLKLNYESSGTVPVGKAKVGGGVRADYFHETSIDNQTIMLAVRTDIELLNVSLLKFDLKETAVRLIDYPDDFYRACGDTFISGYRAGGRLFALLKFSSVSEAEKTEIGGALKTSFEAGVANGKATAELKEGMEKYFSKSQLDIKIFYLGGSFELKPPKTGYDVKNHSTTLDFDEFLASLFGFQTSVIANGNGYPFELFVKKYTELAAYTIKSPDKLDSARPVIDDLKPKYDDLFKMKERIDDIIISPNEFEEFDVTKLTEKEGEVVNKLNAIRLTIRACNSLEEGQVKCDFMPIADTQVDVTLPKRLKPFRLARSPECGPPESWEIIEVFDCEAEANQAEVQIEPTSVYWKDHGVGGPNRGFGTIPNSKYKATSDYCTNYLKVTALPIPELNNLCLVAAQNDANANAKVASGWQLVQSVYSDLRPC